MIQELYKYNIFILKNGELETNLKEFGIDYRNNKNTWISDAIDFLDSEDKEVLENSEIGKFIKKLRK